MSDNEVTPEAAVEAAAKVHYELGLGSWEGAHADTREVEMDDMRAALEAAAPHLNQPRTITTPEELDALEVTAVIRGKWLAEKWADPEGEMWHVAGKGMNWDTEQLIQRGALPATVLYEPGAAE